MVSFTALALIAAGAGALGYFDQTEEPVQPRQAVVAPTRTPAPTIVATAAAVYPVEPLTVTYYLVDNEGDLHALERYEDDMIFREILEKDAIEILLIRNEAEQAEADRVLDEAKQRLEASGFILEVRDLRE
jgi:hypothetical protein